ncbi:hypothetical protein [Lentibacter sp. XHP0401]|uniref:hypothetical protein n=1 Tax=Lentibacter sp. XHP0401 TaxID=2984334 RepID=UPI0021E95B10|nr:hypothetical protein [Lentibacter sp. XHP0401]MCV2893959.1 hypothetical protein [Lentibacter sp. XHP0401]
MKLALAFVMTAGAAWAEEAEPIAAFAPCLQGEIAQFERDLKRARLDSYDGLAPYVDARGADVCGANGIVLCDHGDNPVPCQHALAEEQEALREAVLLSLPVPAGAGLYGRVYALANGHSAGDDCAGTTPVMEAWCEAREATHRFEMAVLAYQLARDAGVVAPAYELGWVQAPAPLRPRAREVQP